MKTEIMGYLIPVFLILMAIESVFAKRKGKDGYSQSETIANLSIGFFHIIVKSFLKTFLFLPFIYIYQNHAAFNIENTSPIYWILCFILFDLIYYIYHRITHSSFLWAIHAVHHQSERINFSAAFRMPLLAPISKSVFYLPLALIGFPVEMVILCEVILQVYQFPLHTETLGHLPRWLGWILCSPADHCIHHTCDEKYLDKNFAGVLIIWDKLFGTYCKTNEKLNYGTIEKYPAGNMITFNFLPWIYLFKKPSQKKYNMVHNSLIWSSKAILILFFNLGLTSVFLVGYSHFSVSIKTILAALILVGLYFLSRKNSYLDDDFARMRLNETGDIAK